MTFRPGGIGGIGGEELTQGGGKPTRGISGHATVYPALRQRGRPTLNHPIPATRVSRRLDVDVLHRQMVVYGAGVTAAFTSLLLSRPALIWPLLKLAPTALRDLTGADSLRVSGLPD